jgi:hypothetical protein
MELICSLICFFVDQIQSIEIMKGALARLWFRSRYRSINITLKKQIKAIAGNVYLNMVLKGGEENNTNINDYNQGFSLNGRSESLIILLL